MKKKLIKLIKALFTYKKYSNMFGLLTYIKILYARRRVRGKIKLFNSDFEYPDAYWLLHSIDEIFFEEVYKFSNDFGRSQLVLDCGSNIGLSVIYFAKKYPNATIIAFEADPNLWQLSMSNIQGQSNKNNIQLINKAVWKFDGSINFDAEGTLGGAIIEGNSTPPNLIKVDTIDLNNYLKNRVDFLKLDIEGAELDVIKHCKSYLINVSSMFIEFHCNKYKDQKLDELLRIVSDAGFRYYVRESSKIFQYPFIEHHFSKNSYDLLLNIFCYREHEFA